MYLSGELHVIVVTLTELDVLGWSSLCAFVRCTFDTALYARSRYFVSEVPQSSGPVLLARIVPCFVLVSEESGLRLGKTS